MNIVIFNKNNLYIFYWIFIMNFRNYIEATKFHIFFRALSIALLASIATGCNTAPKSVPTPFHPVDTLVALPETDAYTLIASMPFPVTLQSSTDMWKREHGIEISRETNREQGKVVWIARKNGMDLAAANISISINKQNEDRTTSETRISVNGWVRTEDGSIIKHQDQMILSKLLAVTFSRHTMAFLTNEQPVPLEKIFEQTSEETGQPVDLKRVTSLAHALATMKLTSETRNGATGGGS